jgi:hypothetical protein
MSADTAHAQYSPITPRALDVRQHQDVKELSASRSR